MATREMKRWCVLLVSDRWEMLLTGGLSAGIMGFEGCMHVEFGVRRNCYRGEP